MRSRQKVTSAVILLAWFYIILGAVGLFLTALRGGKFIDYGAPFQIIIGFGLLQFKEWARIGIIIFSILVLAMRCFLMVAGFTAEAAVSFYDVIVWAILLISIGFFTQTTTKEVFRKV